MSSPKRLSQASNITEGAGPSSKESDSVLPHSVDEKLDPWLISFAPDDPDNPLVRALSGLIMLNVSPRLVELAQVETVVYHRHRWRPSPECVCATLFWSLLTLIRYAFRTFASSAPSNLSPQMMEQFGFGKEVASLAISLFIAGYCVGPLVWGPLSEDVGYF